MNSLYYSNISLIVWFGWFAVGVLFGFVIYILAQSKELIIMYYRVIMILKEEIEIKEKIKKIEDILNKIDF